MTKQDYYMYKQAAGGALPESPYGLKQALPDNGLTQALPESKYGLVNVIRKLLKRKQQQQPVQQQEQVDPSLPYQYTPLPRDTWHLGGYGM